MPTVARHSMWRAVRVVLAQTSGAESAAANPLAGVRITDALEEVNRQLLERDPAATQLTTGAVYNIWPAQEDFQLSLLEHILTGSSVPGVERVDATLEAGIAQGIAHRGGGARAPLGRRRRIIMRLGTAP